MSISVPNKVVWVKQIELKGNVSLLPVQLDADRDEEEVFLDISMMVDNKLFPTKEPVAGNH